MLASLLIACGEAPPPTAPAAATWVEDVAFDPSRFAALLEGERDGWVALHGHDHALAWDRFVAASGSGSVSARRAALGRSVWHEDLALLTREVHARLWSTWRTRSAGGGAAPLPADASWVEAVAADCAGPLSPPDAPPAAAERLNRGAAARDRADVEALEELARAPAWVAQADGFERTWWDPCLDASLARAWSVRARGDDWGGLGGALFGAWATSGDLEEALSMGTPAGELGADAPAVSGTGVTDAGDDADAARARVALLTAATDATAARILDAAPAEGSALAAELALVPRWREQVALAFARRALREGHPEASAVWARASGRGAVPPDPSAAVVLATAELRAGHTREALAALHPVWGPDRDLRSALDPLSDLAVLEGLGKPGDSKEDP
jgi:hypothetical protein